MTGAVAVQTSRLARLTSILRTRGEDGDRAEVHSGTPSDVTARMEAAAARLERVAEKLEKSIS